MRTIVIASRKGGAGKTTIAGHLSVALGEGVAIIDTDPQGSLSDWFAARQQKSPELFAPQLQRLGAEVEGISGMGFRFCVIDTPPAIGNDIQRAISVADLVLIPVRPSPHDLRAVGATVDLADKTGRRVVFVVNGATPRARLTASAAVELSQHGTVAPVTLHSRLDFQVSMIDGRTAQEFDPSGKSAAEVEQLRNYVLAQLGRHAKAEMRK